MNTDYPLKHAVNNMVRVNLNKDGVAIMSYIVKDDVGADEGMKKFMMIVSIFQNFK